KVIPQAPRSLSFSTASTGSSGARVAPPNWSVPVQDTVHRPNENLSSTVGVTGGVTGMTATPLSVATTWCCHGSRICWFNELIGSTGYGQPHDGIRPDPWSRPHGPDGPNPRAAGQPPGTQPRHGARPDREQCEPAVPGGHLGHHRADQG